ncbi:MAG TPA: hypothetical protein VFV41_07795 [Streptosporangiaceae bacterium]|nr:hypothetical protein [Streptosporangiaceae bacterium]
MTAALAAALRACAAGLYCSEAGTELLIGHETFLHRGDFAAFIWEGTSITDGVTPMAGIDWDAAVTALHGGSLPASSGERSVLQLAASIAAGTPVALRDTVTSLDSANLQLLLTAIRHAAGHRPR